jgi:hypothetical protein
VDSAGDLCDDEQHRAAADAGEPPPNLAQLLFIGGDWLIYGIVAPAIFAVSNRWPVARPFVRQRMALHLGFALLTCVAWAIGGKILQFGANYAFNREQVRQFIAGLEGPIWQAVTLDVVGWIFITLPFGVIVYTCVAVLAHAMRYFSDARERELQLARVSEQLAGARFAALQAQLNPHFLFNTLNTIAVRARDGDSTGTVRMVEQLSDLLRRTLTAIAPARFHWRKSLISCASTSQSRRPVSPIVSRSSWRLIRPCIRPPCRDSPCSTSWRTRFGMESPGARAQGRFTSSRDAVARFSTSQSLTMVRAGRVRPNAHWPRHREHARGFAHCTGTGHADLDAASVAAQRRRCAFVRELRGGRPCRALSGGCSWSMTSRRLAAASDSSAAFPSFR